MDVNETLADSSDHYIDSNTNISFDGGGAAVAAADMPPHWSMSHVATAINGSTAGAGQGGVEPSVDFSNLYPAVLECFAIILCGYIAGRSNIISQTETKGLNTFVTYFSLPALIFSSMAKLDFSSVNWLFLLAICLSKTLVFALVAVITMLVQRPINYGKAGLYAIFCTQSNDFALGYPILEALYGKTHPEFPSYLYLMAPISLVFLNPIGFVLMEIGKNMQPQQDRDRGRRTGPDAPHRYGDSTSGDSGDSSSSSTPSTAAGVAGRRLRFAGRILRGILTNPVVAMTLLGILGNVVFDHQLPKLLNGLLEVLGAAFSATALFALGVRMVGKVASLRGASLVLPGILIVVKTIILPLVTREVVSLLNPGGASRNATQDYSNFGFLYGTFPTAPSVFVYAAQYNVQPDLIASSMVAVTFMSAPLMLVSAKMVALVHINPLGYVKELESFLFHVSIIGLISSVWVVLVFLLSRKWRKVPHCITLCLAIAQAMASAGALMWASMDCQAPWLLYFQFTLVTWGVFASRFFTAMLSVTLFLLRWRSLTFVMALRPYLALVGWGVPGLVVLLLVLVVQREMGPSATHDPNFQYGTTQAVTALLLLWFTLCTTIVCLILQQRRLKRYQAYSPLTDAHSSDDLRPLNADRAGSTGPHRPALLPSDCTDDAASTDSDSLFSPTEDLRPLPRHAGPNLDQCNGHCSNRRPAAEAGGGGGQEASGTCDATDGAAAGQTALIDGQTALIDGIGTGADIPGGGHNLRSEHDLSFMNESNSDDCPRKADDDTGRLSDPEAITVINIAGTPNTRDTFPGGSATVNSDRSSRNGDRISRNGDRSSRNDGRSTVSRRRNVRSPSSVRQRRAARLTQPQESNILRDRDDEFQMMRHVVLLLCLCASMVVGFGLCTWTLVSEEVSGVYVEMVFLDAVLNYCQGLFTAIIFGLDTKLIVLPLLRCYRRLVYGASTLSLPPLSALATEDRQVCQQFARYHQDKCCRDIVGDRRWRLKRFRDVFGGQELVDWLLLVGLANDRTHAVRYGRALLAGRIIHHIEDVHHFHDQPLFYAFCSQQPDHDYTALSVESFP